MRLLVTGACGFVGSTLIQTWAQAGISHTIVGFDNLSRPGSETNRRALQRLGVDLRHGDVRLMSDLEALPAVDAVIDAAANPSVLAGTDGRGSSRQLVEHNLVGTLNVLELCRRHSAMLVLLSTSRVYSIEPLAKLPLRVAGSAFEPDPQGDWPAGLGAEGISETFSTAPLVSLYGATKLASELLALEYGSAFGFPVWINRCGVLAGAGQFGRPDQGIFAYWVNSWLRGRPLRYIGFGGKGHQVRDSLHPADLVPLLERQLKSRPGDRPSIVNIGGGRRSARSLRQLTDWCKDRMGDRPVEASPEPRPFDLPWVVLDATRAGEVWAWQPVRTVEDILEEILAHAKAHPDWLDISN